MIATLELDYLITSEMKFFFVVEQMEIHSSPQDDKS